MNNVATSLLLQNGDQSSIKVQVLTHENSRTVQDNYKKLMITNSHRLKSPATYCRHDSSQYINQTRKGIYFS